MQVCLVRARLGKILSGEAKNLSAEEINYMLERVRGKVVAKDIRNRQQARENAKKILQLIG